MIKNLKCEYCDNPVGVDNPRPYLSWEIAGSDLPIYQSEYKVIVEYNGSAVWDSEFVKSGDTFNIEYSGAELESLSKYVWSVTVRTTDGELLKSGDAYFVTGLLDKTLLKAKWIEHPASHDNPVFYGDFYVKEKLISAYILISGLGYYEFKINGLRGHDTCNVPGWTDYSKRDLTALLYPYIDNSQKRVLYNVYDINSFVKTGLNRYEIMLGNGFFNQVERIVEGDVSYGTPRLLMEIHLKYIDGSEDVVLSNQETFCTDGPIEFNNIYFGERRNDNIGMDFTGGLNALECVWEPGDLECQYDSFDKVKENIKPMDIGHGIFDSGRNLSGRARIKAEGPRGAVFNIAYFDNLDEMGNPDYRSSGGEWQIQENRYVFGIERKVDYFETFGWRGFRYFKIDKDDDVTINDISIDLIYADVNYNDSLQTDNKIVKWIHDAYLNSQTSNMHGGVPSDCPHRERLGYTGDGQVTAKAALMSMNCINFYRKWNRDINLSQNKGTGFIPHTVPFNGGGGGPAWGSACAVIPKELYSRTFDKRIIHDGYGVLQNWIGYLEKKNPGLIIENEEDGSWCLGEWCLPIEGYEVEDVNLKKLFSELPPGLINTAFFHYCALTAVDFGKILARDTTYYERLAGRIKSKFNERYFDKDRFLYSTGKHYSNVYPLYFDLVPDEYKGPVLDSLIEQIKSSGYAMDTGIFGASMMFNVLFNNGRDDVISRILSRDEYPSFGYMKKRGATTLWETWDGNASHNHPMFGGAVSFIYQYLAGIRIFDEERRILIAPVFMESVNEFSLTQSTLMGEISVSWKRNGSGSDSLDKISMKIALPGNTRGAVKIGESVQVIENGTSDISVTDGKFEIKRSVDS